jgi:hypothetical protein
VEWVKVKFPDMRSVHIDGHESGKTNMKLTVGEGTHTFHLGDPKNYSPQSLEKRVSGTTQMFPMEIQFEKVTS